MAIARKNLFSKLNNTLFRSIESATTLCKLRGNPYVELVHWFNQLWSQDTDNDFKIIVRTFDIDISQLERDLERAMSRLPTGASSITDFSYCIELAIERAWVYSSLECSAARVRSGHLLIAMLTTMELRRELLAMLPGLERIALDHLTHDMQYILRDSSESHGSDDFARADALPGEASGSVLTPVGAGLAQYTTDLTALAREGKIDPVVGRSQEISTMVDILLRRRQNNPLLTGEAGVGKTAVVEGLALAIASEQVPPALSQVRLLALDVVALSAGASMKGEFEARLKAVLDEAMSAAVPIILFIDEVHTLVGAGGAAGTGDAANLLKPALARGKLRTIGATTWSEFKRHIEKDPALTRRFQVLQIDEPAEDAAVSMLRGLVPTLEAHHGVWIMDEALTTAVRLSHRYIPARQLPDKAIGLLDTACARVATAQNMKPVALQLLNARIQDIQAERERIQKAHHYGKETQQSDDALSAQLADLAEEEAAFCQRWQQEKLCVEAILAQRQQLGVPGEQPESSSDANRETLAQLELSLREIRGKTPLVQAEVNADVVAAIVSDWTGIPVGQMLEDDYRAVAELPQRLQERVIGQPHALQQIAERILVSRAGLGNPNKPVGVFMLVGTSGTGKTETALALAETLYGGEQNLITINMSEYQEAHTVSSLKGAPPGYVGYGEGGVLTEAVRRKPYSVILLDEIEKAHPDIHEIFFQVFDKGWMEDGEGRYIDFKNTTLLMTSNAGSELMTQLYSDPQTAPGTERLLEMLEPELLKIFPPAFLGRLEIIPYLPLQHGMLQVIVRLQLEKISQRLREHYHIELEYADSVLDDIISRCAVVQTGARALIQVVEKEIMPEMGRYVLAHKIEHHGQTLYLNSDAEGKFSVTF
ncbi:type VI secretion system ATPase TssH [Lelliottia wanjuensis]|uniref:Type VI secretion system ATPase TssH n=1 Tax=Lelliottia wanjuensis TaxID=3050585 RepID=A0AAP4CYX7_9ENTR|nr:MULTISPECIES: type VI secretion system ATPase TssH [unclassified Lelliottia]MDK9361827.1 type VI secretion system ATPase TssH [Lelliottia sp. V106_12]MDK9582979.1 type VI secretion system ATPase TssH [Lelliottia sp. V86_10]MDK9618562.1 type VI secretion system ATPase TssH [Lelliottia sp. V106_9]